MAPEPAFVVTVVCPTCSGRLRIRNPALLGQILPCPRCQGLVLIQQEQDQDHDAIRVSVDEPVDSQIETREAIEQSRPPESNAEPVLSGPPPVAWESPQVKRSRQILLVSLLAIFGMFSVSVVFWLFVKAMSNNGPAEVAVVPPIDAFPVEQTNEPDPGKPEAMDATDPRALQPSAEVTQPNPPSVSPDATMVEPRTPANEVVDPSTQVGNTPVGNTPAGNAPGRVLVPPNAQPDPSATVKSEAVPMTDLPPELRQFIPLLNDEAPPLSPEMSLPAPLTADQLRLQLNLPAPPDDRLHPPPAEIVPVRSRLEKALFGLQTDQGSLAALMTTMEQLSGVPIWFDLATLDLGEVDLKRPLQVRVTSKTLGDTIREIATTAGCEATESPTGFVCIRLSDTEIRKRIEPALKFDDLQAEPAWIADYIRRLAGDLNEAGELQSQLKVNIESRTVEVEDPQRLAEAWRAAMALELLRAAKGLPKRLSDTATARWLSLGAPLPPREPSDAEHQLNASYALPLSQWVTLLAKSHKRVVILEWPAVWQHGLVPTKSFLPWTEGVSQQRVLDQLLKPYELKIYEEGPGVWWIGPELSYQNRFVFLAVPLSGEIAQRSEALLPSLTKVFDCDEARLPAVIDPQKGMLLTRVPRGMAVPLAESLK